MHRSLFSVTTRTRGATFSPKTERVLPNLSQPLFTKRSLSSVASKIGNESLKDPRDSKSPTNKPGPKPFSFDLAVALERTRFPNASESSEPPPAAPTIQKRNLDKKPHELLLLESDVSEVKPIPRLPVVTGGWPTPWVNRPMVEQYLYPLYTRGWEIRFLPGNDDKYPDRKVAMLKGRFWFSSFAAGTAFISNVGELAKKENHHPSAMSLSMRRNRPVVTFLVHTHSAIRPWWGQQQRRNGAAPDLKAPGITLRDIRFAIELENIYSDYYIADGRGSEPKARKIWQEDTPKWRYLNGLLIKHTIGTQGSLDDDFASQLSATIEGRDSAERGWDAAIEELASLRDRIENQSEPFTKQ